MQGGSGLLSLIKWVKEGKRSGLHRKRFLNVTMKRATCLSVDIPVNILSQQFIVPADQMCWTEKVSVFIIYSIVPLKGLFGLIMTSSVVH